MPDREATNITTDTASLASLLQRRDAWNGRKRSVLIDDLLIWAFRVELPKADRQSAVGGPVAMGSDTLAMLRLLGTRVQLSGWTGDSSLGRVDDGEPPDPDAVRIGRAVAALDGLEIGLDGVGLLDDAAFDALTVDERAAAHAAGRERALDEAGRLRSSLSAFVITGAVLGRARPVRVVEPIKRTPVETNGRPLWFRRIMRADGAGRPALQVEVDGFDHRRRRPHADAYRKFRLEPDPAPVVAERIEYQAWRFALDWLCTELSGVLERFEPVANAVPWWPWEPGADLVAESGMSDSERFISRTA